ncbi:MAG: hypothetical protein ACK5BN_01595 [Planctomycetota bacterium]
MTPHSGRPEAFGRPDPAAVNGDNAPTIGERRARRKWLLDTARGYLRDAELRATATAVLAVLLRRAEVRP